MACPTCDHTLRLVACRGLVRFFWCPRCGTLLEVKQTGTQEEPGSMREISPTLPRLVVLCRMYSERNDVYYDWFRLRIEEAIHLPEDRGEF